MCIFIGTFLILLQVTQYTLAKIPIVFEPEEINQLLIGSQSQVTVWSLENLENVHVFSTHPDVAATNVDLLIFSAFNATHFSAYFNVTGVFLGYTQVVLRQNTSVLQEQAPQSEVLKVSVIREPGMLDRIFVISVATLVSLIYINFGCALDWNVLKACLIRPVSPAIGFFSQFGFMPLMSFLLGRLLFPDNIAMQLGLFFTGCAPGGGASNIWTVALGGNLDLSITMTTISTFSSFAMIPLWVFTLGRVIFETGKFAVPYSKISQVAAGLLIPLLVGTLIQIYLPKFSALMVKLMKPFAVFLIIFIVVFGTVANLYIFSLFDWKIIIAGLCIPWLGYLFGGILSQLCGFNLRDTIAIAVETGVQNTGIAIYMLRFALEQPAADLAQVCPVAVSLMTPLPLALLSLWLRLRERRKIKKQGVEILPSTELYTPSLEQPANSDKF